MKVVRCETCGNEAFEVRAVCQKCFGERFAEVEAGEPKPVVSVLLTVTPEGFEDSYEVVVGTLGRTRAIYRKS